MFVCFAFNVFQARDGKIIKMIASVEKKENEVKYKVGHKQLTLPFVSLVSTVSRLSGVRLILYWEGDGKMSTASKASNKSSGHSTGDKTKENYEALDLL